MVGSKSQISLVYEFLETDVENIIKSETVVLTTADIKSIVAMTLKGLEFLHAYYVLHRDLKPGNLLISSKGIIKVRKKKFTN